MPPDPRKYLWDAREAADAIFAFTRDKTFEDFTRDLLLRSAVERQFEIVGEALSQLARANPEMAERIRGLRRIVAFRNILVHGYATIDRQRVWNVIADDLPKLRADLARLLGEG